MFKKPLLLIFIAGVILLIAGIVLSPSFIGSFTEGGSITTFWGIIGTNLFQFYLILLGAVIILISLVIGLFKAEKKISHYMLAFCFIGIVIAASGIILSPSLVEDKLDLTAVATVDRLASLVDLRGAIITAGFIIIIISLILYSFHLKRTIRFIFIVIPLLIIVYLGLIYNFYIKDKYPANIILKEGSFGKVTDLLLGRNILFSDFDPEPSIRPDNKVILKSKYPAIDIHFGFASDFITDEDRRVLAPENLLRSMDSVGVKMIIGLDGKNIENLLDRYQKKYPDRFMNFYNILLGSSRVLSDKFLADLPSRLESYAGIGVKGIGEFPKDLGLRMYDESGKLIRMDDPRLDPFFAKAGELGIPIVWHAADPTPFFKPIDRHNERFIELRNYPQWSYANPRFPSKEEILIEKENVIRKHPGTIFIGAHMSWITDDLGYLAKLLDKYPNYYVEIGSALSELGRQPYTSREFCIKYQDRILFGTDGGSLFNVDGWTVERFYRAHWEFLETDNEYIAYPMQGAINQGDWKIYGLNLPDEVLEKIYYKNAEKILEQ